MTTALILNLILDLAVVASIVGLLAWSVATRHRDFGGAAPRWAWRRRLARPRPRSRAVGARARLRAWTAS